MFSLKEAVFRCMLLLLGFARLRKHAQNPGRNKDSENIHLGSNQIRRTEYTPLKIYDKRLNQRLEG